MNTNEISMVDNLIQKAQIAERTRIERDLLEIVPYQEIKEYFNHRKKEGF